MPIRNPYTDKFGIGESLLNAIEDYVTAKILLAIDEHMVYHDRAGYRVINTELKDNVAACHQELLIELDRLEELLPHIEN